MRNPASLNADSRSRHDAHVASVTWFVVNSRGLAALWLAFGLLLSMVLVVVARAQGAGVVEGKLVNGTADGQDPGSGLTVLLRVYRGELEEDTLETTTDAEGRFRFDGLDTDASLEYWPEAVYGGVSFSSAEPLQFGGEPITVSTTITVYETTDDDSAIRLGSVHIIAESFGQVLRISEIHLLGNTGDRVYVGPDGDAGQGETIFVPLPEQGVGVAFGEGVAADRFVEVEGGLADTAPVLPGSESSLIFFSYHLMVTGETVPLERRFSYPVTSLNILVAQPGLTLNSEQLQSMGIELFQDRQYELQVTQNIPADEPLIMEFVPVETAGGTETTGMSATSGQGMTGASTRGNQRVLLPIGAALAALAVLGAVLYPQVTRRAAHAPVSGPNLKTDPEAQRLVAELASLEKSYEAGELDEATYERQRSDRYEKLTAL
jgi:hypothetical protein